MNNAFFYKISLTLLGTLLLVGVILMYISNYTAQKYYEEANQQLNAELATYTADHIETFNSNGDIDTAAIQDIMHSMMVINPDVEVYLLDSLGGIMTHVAPYKKVVREKVDLGPVREFIDSEGEAHVRGDDPRYTDRLNVFSAAPILRDDKVIAYYYIILASQERASVLSSLRNTYTLRLGIQLILLALLFSLALGILAIWYQTRSLRSMTKVMSRFRSGDYTARVNKAGESDFPVLAKTFNDMAEQIQENINKIEATENFRKELIANISHDLRTPLSIIQGYTETLMLNGTERSDETYRKYLGNIHESTLRLSGLVQQLFELSKLENNQVQVNREPFRLDELTGDILSRYEIVAGEKKLTLNLEKPEEVPVVFADVFLVERLIQNLLDNAIKFTRDGSEIKIQISVEDDDVRFAITDQGEGIPEDEATAIFERYKKSDGPNGKQQGIGLGLAIAKKIVELHDSNIQVRSRINEGSTFSFNLRAFASDGSPLKPA